VSEVGHDVGCQKFGDHVAAGAGDSERGAVEGGKGLQIMIAACWGGTFAEASRMRWGLISV
jgi:hypothetical protein